MVDVPAALTEDHREYLRARGVGADRALDAGVRSAGDWQVRALQARSRFAGSGFAIPYDGDYWVIRLDFANDGRKFIYPPNEPTRPYLPPVVDSAVWADPSKDIVLCEGPVKALSLSLAGIPAIGLAGATGGGHNAAVRRQQGLTHLHPVLLERVQWAGRRAFIMLDNDRHTNRTVRAGEDIVAQALLSAGAVPFSAAVPVIAGHEKLGADDFLVLKGVEAVLEHLRGAKRWAPARKPRRGFGWTLTRRTEVMVFLESYVPIGHRVSSRRLFDLYLWWCDQQNVPAVTETMLMRRIQELPNMTKARIHGRSFWTRSK